MPDATFNGDTLTITLFAGGMSHFVDVQTDLYSAWKRWMLTDPQNQGYPPAFSTEGGFDVNPTTGLKAGRYFFLNNAQGWHIKPAEEDATIYFTGNLIPNDFDHNILLPTDGAFTVLIDGLQPITQIAPGSVSAQQVWDYMMSSGNLAEDELIKARKAAEMARNLSA